MRQHCQTVGMLLHDVAADEQAQSQTLGPGAVERLEKVRQNVRRDAPSAVGEGNAYASRLAGVGRAHL